MSYQAAEDPVCTGCDGAVELVIEPVKKDLGELVVRRVLPAPERRMVGPFIFFDHMGPASFPPGKGIAVRPHPHIGLATITYLFEGEIIHRDSLGYVQPIQAGAVNLMTAGRGIVHSERAGDDLGETLRLHGIQSWMALPDSLEETRPAFAHYPASELPQFEHDGVEVTVIVGDAYGHRSPVVVAGSMLYLECRMAEGSALTLPDTYTERAVYVVSGDIRIDARSFSEGAMAVAASGKRVTLHASAQSRVMVIGGEPVGERHVWWNFVSSSKSRIEQAKQDWSQGNFEPVPGETEFIPLPDR